MASRTSFRRTPKFSVGGFITSPQEVIDAAASGKWLYLGTDRHARVYHPAWIANMNFSCVMSYVARKQLAFAKRNPEYPWVFRAQLMESHVPDITSEWWVTCTEIPNCKIVAITKHAVCREAEEIASKHAGYPARVQVRFEMPEAATRPVALLAP